MKAEVAAAENAIPTLMLEKNFNKKKFSVNYAVTTNSNLLEIQNLSRVQCLGKKLWPEVEKVDAWMISAETAVFMKWGGLGMVASELPEAFNRKFGSQKHKITVVTPMYLGNTGKKKAELKDELYVGAERVDVKVEKIKTIDVRFCGEKSTLNKYKVDVYMAHHEASDYIFLSSDRFFNIDPHKNNPSAQDGCYIMNQHGINEVERFAFFSKAVYTLIESLYKDEIKEISKPNVLIANDWHSGALSGLLKYFTIAQVENKKMEKTLAEKIKNLPIIHIAHHLGYQGWDYENTSKILNSLYGDAATMVFKNAKAIKNSNPRATNTLIVYDCYNQASCNFHLADRVVTVSKNYMEEVSKELGFGFDFRDILKIRKDHRNFFGIVNGYDKNLISPNKDKIDRVNNYFGDTDFTTFDENSLDKKLHNKKEFIKLISRIASDEEYRRKVIPLIDIYKFEDVAKSIKDPAKTPIVCATSRLVEQKGYDIAAQAIVNLAQKYTDRNVESPIFVLGGAGDVNYFELLSKVKDRVQKINKRIAERIFVFRGYKDEFAYAVQLASDFYMMPCRFEPCGLTQMEAMAKGSLPVAMSTGGLVDTIEDGVDGFRTEAFFSNKRRVYGTNLAAQRLKNNENAYTETLEKALIVFYRNPQKIYDMQKNAMHKDFSWDVEGGSVYKYFNLLTTGHL
ncbi:MAG: glycogen/starch synthase [Alphaproteobacteria bacterium]|nr:glycogen/starch synthase [Alphaproteobacteria bacterium]